MEDNLYDQVAREAAHDYHEDVLPGRKLCGFLTATAAEEAERVAEWWEDRGRPKEF